MTTAIIPEFGISSDERTRAAEALQASLVDLIGLALQLKQAHWNLRGAQFRPVHEHLDEIEAAVRAHSDDVAERIVTLGLPADGRAQSVAENSRIEPLPAGRLSSEQTVEALTASLSKLVRGARESLSTLAEADAVSEGLMTDIIGDIEKHAWMLRAQIEV